MARIVIAEDEAHLGNLLKAWLARSGHEVVVTTDGGAALAALAARPVEILITDIRMPGMNGVELARLALHTYPTLRRVFVITAWFDQQEVLDRLPDPRVRVFRKPFSPSQLLRECDWVAAAAHDPPAPGVPAYAADPGPDGDAT